MRKISDRQTKLTALLFGIFVCFLINIPLAAQDFPDQLYGYKIYKTKISVSNQANQTAGQNDSETLVKIGEPKLTDVSLTGLTLEIPAEILTLPESGKIDFLTFYDFRVNGLPIEIEDYREPFKLTKNQSFKLSKPVKLFVPTAQAARGAIREMRNSKNDWRVTGRIFVFGRFKKFGLTFKRAVPIEIDLQIKNPLNNKDSNQASAALPNSFRSF